MQVLISQSRSLAANIALEDWLVCSAAHAGRSVLVLSNNIGVDSLPVGTFVIYVSPGQYT